MVPDVLVQSGLAFINAGFGNAIVGLGKAEFVSFSADLEKMVASVPTSWVLDDLIVAGL